MLKINQTGFTLFEIIVVMAIVSILSTALYPQVTQYINRAKITSAESEIEQFKKIVLNAQLTSEKPSKDITGRDMSELYCRVSQGRHIKDPSCAIIWEQVLDTFLPYSDSKTTYTLRTDPWGYPYLFDENNMTSASVPDCDKIASYGLYEYYYPNTYPDQNSLYIESHLSLYCGRPTSSGSPRNNYKPPAL